MITIRWANGGIKDERLRAEMILQACFGEAKTPSSSFCKSLGAFYGLVFIGVEPMEWSGGLLLSFFITPLGSAALQAAMPISYNSRTLNVLENNKKKPHHTFDVLTHYGNSWGFFCFSFFVFFCFLGCSLQRFGEDEVNCISAARLSSSVLELYK